MHIPQPQHILHTLMPCEHCGTYLQEHDYRADRRIWYCTECRAYQLPNGKILLQLPPADSATDHAE